MESLATLARAAFIGVPLAAGAAGIGGTLYLTTHDVEFDFNDTTNAAIEENSLTARQVCNELVKSQNSVVAEFNSRGVELPTVTMTMDECLLRTALPQLLNQRP